MRWLIITVICVASKKCMPLERNEKWNGINCPPASQPIGWIIEATVDYVYAPHPPHSCSALGIVRNSELYIGLRCGAFRALFVVFSGLFLMHCRVRILSSSPPPVPPSSSSLTVCCKSRVYTCLIRSNNRVINLRTRKIDSGLNKRLFGGRKKMCVWGEVGEEEHCWGGNWLQVREH